MNDELLPIIPNKYEFAKNSKIPHSVRNDNHDILFWGERSKAEWGIFFANSYSMNITTTKLCLPELQGRRASGRACPTLGGCVPSPTNVKKQSNTCKSIKTWEIKKLIFEKIRNFPQKPTNVKIEKSWKNGNKRKKKEEKCNLLKSENRSKWKMKNCSVKLCLFSRIFSV